MHSNTKLELSVDEDAILKLLIDREFPDRDIVDTRCFLALIETIRNIAPTKHKFEII